MATVHGYSSWGHKKLDMTEQTRLASNLAFQGLLKYLWNESVRENPSSAICQLCDLRRVTYPLCASVDGNISSTTSQVCCEADGVRPPRPLEQGVGLVLWAFLLLLVTEHTSGDSWAAPQAAALSGSLPLLRGLEGQLDHIRVLVRVTPAFRGAGKGRVIASSPFGH